MLKPLPFSAKCAYWAIQHAMLNWSIDVTGSPDAHISQCVTMEFDQTNFGQKVRFPPWRSFRLHVRTILGYFAIKKNCRIFFYILSETRLGRFHLRHEPFDIFQDSQKYSTLGCTSTCPNRNGSWLKDHHITLTKNASKIILFTLRSVLNNIKMKK